jgi:hypothetical protein
LLDEWRGISVDGAVLVGVNGASFIDGLSNNINDSAKSLGTHRHHDGVTSVQDSLSTNETLSWVKSDRADVVATQVLGDFENEAVLGSLHLKGIEDGGKLAFKLHVDDGTNNLRNLSVCLDGSGKAA